MIIQFLCRFPRYRSSFGTVLLLLLGAWSCEGVHGRVKGASALREWCFSTLISSDAHFTWYLLTLGNPDVNFTRCFLTLVDADVNFTWCFLTSSSADINFTRCFLTFGSSENFRCQVQELFYWRWTVQITLFEVLLSVLLYFAVHVSIFPSVLCSGPVPMSISSSVFVHLSVQMSILPSVL